VLIVLANTCQCPARAEYNDHHLNLPSYRPARAGAASSPEIDADNRTAPP
jgi:hypothetical protein